MFHLTEESNSDYDRLQLGRIVLIEMNIVIFSHDIFLVCPQNQTHKSRPTLCSHCTNNRGISNKCHSGVVVSSSLGENNSQYEMMGIPDPTEIF